LASTEKRSDTGVKHPAVETTFVDRSGKVIQALVGDERGDVFSVADVIRFIWRGRTWVALAAVAGLIVATIFVIATAISKSTATTYRTAIAITMKGAKPGEYPSGAPYAPSDLRSPAVLDTVYKNSNLQAYGLGPVDFNNAISVEAFSPSIETITERYRARLRAKNITPEEIKSVEETYRTDLAAARSDGILVSLTLDGKFEVPDEIGRKVAASVPSVWSQVFIESLGVISFPVPRSAADLVDQRLVDSLDYPLAFDYVEKSIKELELRLAAIADIPNARNVAVKDATETLFDLQRRTDNSRAFYIEKIMRPIVDKGLSRSAALTLLAYENRSQLISIEEKSDMRKSASLSSLIRERNASDMPGVGAPGGLPGVQGAPASAGTNISTVGDGVVDRIVALSISSAGAQFREQLLNEKLGIETAIADNEQERLLIDRRLAGIRSQGSGADLPDRESLVTAFNAATKVTIAELNDIWQRSNEILSAVNSNRLNQDKQLYASLPIVDAQTSTPFYISTFLWAVFFGIIVLSALAGLIAYVLFSIVEKPAMFIRRKANA
jgi:hypothetical protein